MKNNKAVLLVLLAVGSMLALFLFVERRPLLFANTTYLGGILAVQIAIIGLTHFEEAYFPMLMGSFLWAGTFLPFYSVGMSLRWLFLAVGALAGFVIWIKTPRAHHFKAFHLIALFCVVSALVSALVSDIPRIALLKVVSLFLLFLYASAGARVAVAGREQSF